MALMPDPLVKPCRVLKLGSSGFEFRRKILRLRQRKGWPKIKKTDNVPNYFKKMECILQKRLATKTGLTAAKEKQKQKPLVRVYKGLQ